MKHAMVQELEALQLALFDIENEGSDTEEASIRSQTTAATSVQPELPKRRPLPHVSRSIQAGACNLANMLDCLADMAVQETEQIERCLADAAETLLACLAMNTYTVPRSRLYPAVFKPR